MYIFSSDRSYFVALLSILFMAAVAKIVEIQTKVIQMTEVFARGVELVAVLDSVSLDLEKREFSAVFCNCDQMFGGNRTQLEADVKPVSNVWMMVQ